jgi:thiamine kinase-like enzyme
MKYHYEKGDVLSRIRNFNADMLSSLLTWTNNRLWKLKKEKENPENFKHLCRSFYYDKTISRVEMFMRQRNDRDTAHIINGVNVPDVETLLEYAEKDSLFEGVCGKIHGDFILENIVRTEDESFMLIDWRQDFAGDLHSGDVYYDLAKLNHNLYVNHDIIRNGGFTCEINSTGGIYVDLHCAHRFVAAQKEIEKFCQRHNLSHKKVKMLSSIIWINMSPLHDKRFGDFLFYFGKLQLHNLTHEQ